MVTRQNTLYYIGGSGVVDEVGQTFDTIERYDAATNQWQLLDLPRVYPGEGVYSHTAIVY